MGSSNIENDQNELFHISSFPVADKDSLATIEIIQKYPIHCQYQNNTVRWFPFTPTEETTGTKCLISVQPKICYGDDRKCLSDIQTSMCPIQFDNASACTFRNSSKDSQICNMVKFNVSLDENAKETLLLNLHSEITFQEVPKVVDYRKVQSSFYL